MSTVRRMPPPGEGRDAVSLRRSLAVLGVAVVIVAATLVLRPWGSDAPSPTTPAGTTRVGDYQPNASSAPIEQWKWVYVATDALVEGKPTATGRPTWLNPNATATATKDDAHPVEVSRMPDGTWVSRGEHAAYCAIRRDADQPAGWVRVFAVWRGKPEGQCIG